MPAPFGRRRMIAIAGAVAGLCLPGSGREAGAGSGLLTEWRGTVLGAVGTIQLHHPDPSEARRLVHLALAETRRLEGIFSLYRPDSALVTLNRQGALVTPPADLVRLLQESLGFAELTGGAFDTTIQPLWRLLYEHFAQPGADPAGPPADIMAAALQRVGCEHLRLSRDRIALARPGMAVTLNGIAQGYITDRITELLRAEGIAQTMVDLGEVRVLGTRPDGQPWQVGLENPDAPGQPWKTLDLVDRAVATSGGYGLVFDAAGRFSHILDPRTGRSAHRYRSISVVAPDATTADALSTAFTLIPEPAMEAVLARRPDIAVHLVRADGSTALRHAAAPSSAGAAGPGPAASACPSGPHPAA